MTPELLSPSSDIVFKMLFGDERNTDILGAFLKAVLLQPEDDFAEITILNPFLGSEYPDEKTTILDVKALTASGRRIDIEIQMKNHSALKQRILLYTARMLTEQGGEGVHYNKIRPVVCILITDFRMIANEDYHNRYRLFDPMTGSEFSDLLEINVLELPKLPTAAKDDDVRLLAWMKFLKAKSKEEMEMLAQQYPHIQKAVRRVVELSADEKARMLYEARIKNELDMEAYADDAREEGRAKGHVEVAANLLKMGVLSTDAIAQATGLSEQEVLSLGNEKP